MEPILDPEYRALEESLMQAGRDVGMSDAMRKQTLAALGVGATGAVTAAAVKTGWLASASGKVGLFGVLGVVVGTAGVVGWTATRLRESEVRREIPAAPLSAARSLPPVSVSGTKGAATEAPSVSETAGALPEDEKGRTGAGAARPTPESNRGAASVSSAPSTLKLELQQIGEVERALRKADSSQALVVLEDYRRRFPHAQLGLEAEVLTIQALSLSGSSDAAKQRAARFVAKYPKSPLSARVKRYLE